MGIKQVINQVSIMEMASFLFMSVLRPSIGGYYWFNTVVAVSIG